MLPTERDCLSRIKELYYMHTSHEICTGYYNIRRNSNTHIEFITNLKFTNLKNIHSIRIEYGGTKLLWEYITDKNTSYVTMPDSSQIPCKIAHTENQEIVCDIWEDLDVLNLAQLCLTDFYLVINPIRDIPFSLIFSYDAIYTDLSIHTDYKESIKFVDSTQNFHYPHIVRNRLFLVLYNTPIINNIINNILDYTSTVYHKDMSTLFRITLSYHESPLCGIYRLKWSAYLFQKKYRRKMLRRKLEKFIA